MAVFYMKIDIIRSISICCDAMLSQGHGMPLPRNLRICAFYEHETSLYEHEASLSSFVVPA
jgi:hypothetical protein